MEKIYNVFSTMFVEKELSIHLLVDRILLIMFVISVIFTVVNFLKMGFKKEEINNLDVFDVGNKRHKKTVNEKTLRNRFENSLYLSAILYFIFTKSWVVTAMFTNFLYVLPQIIYTVLTFVISFNFCKKQKKIKATMIVIMAIIIYRVLSPTFSQWWAANVYMWI